MPYPRQSDVAVPLLKTLQQLGGSAPPQDVYPRVAAYFPQLTTEDLEQRLESYPSTRKWWNLVQWVRQRLVESGEIDGSVRGIWTLTPVGLARIAETEGAAPIPHVEHEISRANDSSHIASIREEITLRDLANLSRDAAKSRLLQELKQLAPQAFEHFCIELLQQLGYSNMEVTGRSADGGIDGFGDFRQGAIKIKSAFQAKRWSATPVGRPEIDKLRGAIQGDFDHGVFLTTSRFTPQAESVSYKKGAISILLLDGDAITELMLERGIGVRREPVYLFEVTSEFFDFGS